jgi:hypothetical protein
MSYLNGRVTDTHVRGYRYFSSSAVHHWQQTPILKKGRHDKGSVLRALQQPVKAKEKSQGKLAAWSIPGTNALPTRPPISLEMASLLANAGRAYSPAGFCFAFNSSTVEEGPKIL